MVRENRSTIYTVCYMFSNDQDEVADLFQEVLINLWKSLPSFEERGDVRSWIYRVSLNVCISLDRKKRRNKTVSLTMDISMREIHLSGKDGVMDGYIDMLVQDKKNLELMIQGLRKIEGVQDVVRTDI